MVDRFLSKRAAIVDTVNNFVAEWGSLLSDIYLLKKGNVKPVKSSFKSVNLCKFTAWCTDVLADKPHPRFDTEKFEQKGAAYTPVFTVHNNQTYQKKPWKGTRVM